MYIKLRKTTNISTFFKYLASGCTFTELYYSYRLGISTTKKIAKDVCKALRIVMKPECIQPLKKEVLESIASGFESAQTFCIAFE